ncbi:MAG: TenA family transcriptional regulator [Actinomycetota bacterium]
MHDSLWTAATQHRFLDAVREGSIDAAAFDRWLVQDALFVTDLLTFQARLLARAPRAAQNVLAGGCVALVAELDWFDVKADERGLDMVDEALPATLSYRELLARLDTAPADEALTALWAIEKVYLLAWTHATSDGSPFAEFVEHWTVPGFAAYVDGLEQRAEPHAHADREREVLEHEIAFWDMALEQ